MKKFVLYITLLGFAFFCASVSYAQQTNALGEFKTVSEEVVADSLVSKIPPTVDSTLLGRNVFELIGSNGDDIKINRRSSVDRAFEKYIKNNAAKKIHGYRIRIFFDNKQTARVQSEEVEKLFLENFPHYPVYRTYTNPYFKVAAGDFRTRTDAVKVLKEIAAVFPNAFVIRDVINFPF